LALDAQLASGDGMLRLDLEVVVGEDDMNNYHNRQIARSATCAKRNLPVFNLLRGRF